MKQKFSEFWTFITNDIWRVTEDEVTKRRFSFYTILKTIYLCVDRFTKDRLTNKASALTYSTLLATIPILAVLFAIARGFGFANLMENQLRNGMGGSDQTSETILMFVDSYLSQTQGGVFIGVGLVMLLWTVINLITDIETTFNQIWQVKHGRSMYRKITDYFSMLLLMPIMIVLSGGLSIFMSTMLEEVSNFALMAPLVKFFIRLTPFAVTWVMFTALYMFMPNTKVKLKHALISAIIAGSAYQGFQYLYISGQIWVSKYNAIYGSFAALPMFLLWLQTSWTICLFGVQLTYAEQNIRNFSFDKNTKNVSRRFSDFIAILIMSLIAKRFEQNEPPYTADQLATDYNIPLRLTNQTLYHLQEINLIHEVATDHKSDIVAYQPSIDINQLNVALLIDRLDTYGSEDFKIDTDNLFSEQWKVLIDSRAEFYQSASQVLLKDL